MAYFRDSHFHLPFRIHRYAKSQVHAVHRADSVGCEWMKKMIVGQCHDESQLLDHGVLDGHRQREMVALFVDGVGHDLGYRWEVFFRHSMAVHALIALHHNMLHHQHEKMMD
jgi:hypothetical protein